MKKLLLISLAVMTVVNMVARIFGNSDETGRYPSGEGAFNYYMASGEIGDTVKVFYSLIPQHYSLTFFIST